RGRATSKRAERSHLPPASQENCWRFVFDAPKAQRAGRRNPRSRKKLSVEEGSAFSADTIRAKRTHFRRDNRNPCPSEALRAGLCQRPHAAVAVAAGLAPDAGDGLVAVRAQAIGAHAALLHVEAVALHDRRAAVVAARVLPLADLAGEVAGVHVLQADLLAV